MLIIPAIDIYNGKCARLVQGDFNTVKYYTKTPIELAKEYSSNGFEWMHIVDLHASLDGIITIQNIVNNIKASTSLKIQFGGGIKSFSAAKELLSAGADRILVGSLALNNKEEFEKIISQFGTDKIAVAVDAKNEIVMAKGWTENSGITIWQHMDYCSRIGIKTVLCTDISKDGMLKGTNIHLYKKIKAQYPQIFLIASGGVGSFNDVKLLSEENIDAVVIGKALFENKVTLEELKTFVS